MLVKAQSVSFQDVQISQCIYNGFAFGTIVSAFPNRLEADQNGCLGHLYALGEQTSVCFVQSSVVFILPWPNPEGLLVPTGNLR
jgi:hypothetical protein